MDEGLLEYNIKRGTLSLNDIKQMDLEQREKYKEQIKEVIKTADEKKKDIMAIRDTTKRQSAIAENHELFGF